MATRDKLYRPKDDKRAGKYVHIRHNPKTGRYDVDVRFTREDGSVFRRASSAETLPDALRAREAAYLEWFRDRGEGKDQARKKRQDKADTLRGWTERVLPIIQTQVAPATFEAYGHSLRLHVLPALGDLALEEVKALRVQELLLALQKEKSLNVASQARSALNKVLHEAVVDERISVNPVRLIKVGARERKISRMDKAIGGESGKRWLTPEEGAKVLETAEGTPAYLPCLLGLRFGLRSGESMGLKWSDVDLVAKVLRVRRQAQYLKGSPRHVSTPKSASGVRDLPIPADLLEQLKAAKAAAVSEWVCVDERGEPLHPKHVTRRIKDVVLAAGLDGKDGKPVPTSHDFRSTYLSWLANYANGGAGVKPHVLMKLAGHSDVQVTMSYYLSASDEDLASAVNSLDLSGAGSKLDKVLAA